jgi:hypothetical protein
MMSLDMIPIANDISMANDIYDVMILNDIWKANDMEWCPWDWSYDGMIWNDIAVSNDMVIWYRMISQTIMILCYDIEWYHKG